MMWSIKAFSCAFRKVLKILFTVPPHRQDGGYKPALSSLFFLFVSYSSQEVKLTQVQSASRNNSLLLSGGCQKSFGLSGEVEVAVKRKDRCISNELVSTPVTLKSNSLV